MTGNDGARSRLATPGSGTTSFLYAQALRNLLDINTVTGRSAEEPARFVRAGGGYPEPWTRDAAINAWNAASSLSPDIARDTLLMVCDGDVLAQDDQWWDQIIWVVAAWHHYVVTGDEEFLATAYGIGTRSLSILHGRRFRPEFGLYAGGAVMQDGISGYPQPPWEPGIESSFVLDYPHAHEVMCLSTNATYVAALRALGAMGRALNAAPDDVTPDDNTPPGHYDERADALTTAINTHLWRADAAQYAYLLHGAGRERGTLAEHEEACGIAFAALFGIAPPGRARAILRAAHREPQGVVNVWPHFPERFSAEQPGRHNAICWPMVMGMFGAAAAVSREPAVFTRTLDDLERLFAGSDGGFSEIYNATTGEVDGGWQTGAQWRSEPDQTWSATAYLRLIHEGAFGMRFGEAGLRFEPIVPRRLSGATLTGFRYRDATLNIALRGHGTRVVGTRLDGRRVAQVSAGISGAHDVEVEIAP